MDIYWPLRSGKVRDVRSGEVIPVEAIPADQLMDLFWYLFELHQEFAGDPEQLDAALTMVKTAASIPDAGHQGTRTVGGQDVSFDQALEAARQTMQAHEASLDQATGEDWGGAAP